jgi:hypothetical protein
MKNNEHVAELGVLKEQFEDAYCDPLKIPIQVDSRKAVYEAKTQNNETITIVLGFNHDGSIRPITAYKKEGNKSYRTKLQFPWEIPELVTEQDIRKFWDTHEVTETLLEYSLAVESFEVIADNHAVNVNIENIPAIRLWTSKGTLISSCYESHIEKSLEELKNRVSEGIRTYSEKVVKSRRLHIDFKTKKVKTVFL